MGKASSKATDTTVLLEHLPFEMDQGIAARASIGLIVLATDYTIEYEWRRLFAEVAGVALYHSRIYNENHIAPETLRAIVLSTPIDQRTQLYPYIYLADDLVVDVHVLSRDGLRQLDLRERQEVQVVPVRDVMDGVQLLFVGRRGDRGVRRRDRRGEQKDCD